MPDDDAVTLAIPRWVVSRVRAARRALVDAEGAFHQVRDRGERLEAEGRHAAAAEEVARAEAMLVREVLALASKQGA